MDVASLPTWSALAVSVAAGAASFLSPCVAPLLPGYVAFVAGGDARTGRSTAVPRAIGFVAGFTLLFALLGATAAAFSRQLVESRTVLELVSGLLVALLGLAMAFNRSIVPARMASAAQRSSTRHRAPATVIAALPVGAAFAIAWTPCIGPALAAILALAAGSGSAPRGAALLVAYGLGLGIPFVLGAVALDRVSSISRALREHARVVRASCGILLMLLGVAIATGRFGEITARLARIAPDWLV